MKTKKQIIWRYAFAVAVILAGAILSYYNLGNEFLGFASVGNCLLYIGFVMLAIITLQLKFNRKRIVDERMQFIATKAGRITFLAIILAAFIVMVLDAINPITISYSYFMSYFICAIVFVYFISYKILLRYN